MLPMIRVPHEAIRLNSTACRKDRLVTLRLAAPLHSERVLIRPLLDTDLDALFPINGDDEVTRFLPYKTWHTMDDARAWLTRTRTLETAGNAVQLVLLRADATRSTVIGTCLLFNAHEH